MKKAIIAILIIILIVATGTAVWVYIDNEETKKLDATSVTLKEELSIEFGKKAKMLSTDEVETLVGHAVGGVCPFAANEGVEVYLDVSLKRFGTVFPACGSSNSAIELTIPELEEYSGYVEWVDVCKGD